MITTAEIVDRLESVPSIDRLLELGCRRHADKAFIRWRGETTTYAEFDADVARVAGALTGLGVREGDRVAVMMTNSPDWLALWFAVVRTGAVLVPINTAHKSAGLRYQLEDCRPSVLVLDPGFVIHLDVTQLEHRPRHVLTAVPRSTTPPVVATGLGPHSPAAILYTSGTTGPPKGCLLPHGQYVAASFLHADACGYDESTVIYTCLPLFHINAQNYTVLSALAAGGTVALDDRFSASQFWDRLTEVGATAFNFIGSMAASLWNQPERESERQHGARVGFGVPLAPEIWESWEKRFGVRVVYTYGMTENALPAIVDSRETPVPAARRGSSGQASPTSEIAVVDEHDRPLGAGEIGQILTRARIPWTMTTEYVGRPDATAEAFRNHWFHTGDLGYLDADGYLFFVDRLKDAVRRRGEMVSSWEVETVVAQYPGVSECAMVGVSSELGDDDILVVLVTDDPGFDPARLVAFCGERLAHFQVPRYVRRVEELPKTQTQRVEKYRLRHEGLLAGDWDAGVPRRAREVHEAPTH
ncbi:AMP-binding protein [Pseudonocardia nematodicida]|uniref:AMP-binding protein n=1 Tax=Pseudonocardia nematodicida TaxID=1206997 RepID=A0ABV1KC26_9PSEU